MPKICQFYGIAIYMYWRDHAPPHVHAVYAQFEAEIEIATGRVERGHLPPRARRLVRAWVLRHTRELALNWERATNGEPIDAIPPLE